MSPRRKPVELVYGKSGSGKTTWWLKLLIYLHKTAGVRARVYHGMGGEETIFAAIDQGELPEDAVEVINYTAFDNPFETCQFAVEGLTHDGVKWAKAEPRGLYVFEGLTGMANYLMGDKEGGLAARAAKGEKLGQDSPINFTDGKLKVGGNPPSHFGIVQRKILHLIEETRRLPGWVIWTAHERDAEDKETQEKLVGPDVAGKALTSKIGGSFGNTIHLDSASKRIKVTDPISGKPIDVLSTERRAYFTEHFDPDGVMLKKYFANNRAFNPARLPACGYLTPPDPIKFYELLRSAQPVATTK